METEKLIEILTRVGQVRNTQWKTVLSIVDIINEGSVIEEDKKWGAVWKNNHPESYPLDLSKIKTWSTYDKCVDLQFSSGVQKGGEESITNLICKAKIYDGDIIDGQRELLRFEALLYLPVDFALNIKDDIEWAFKRYLEEEYEEHLETQKKLWIDNRKAEIVGEQNNVHNNG